MKQKRFKVTVGIVETEMTPAHDMVTVKVEAPDAKVARAFVATQLIEIRTEEIKSESK